MAVQIQEEPLLSVCELTKSFGGNKVLKGISFDVRENDVISIIGASGSGKSTLLRCINLLERPDAGRIIYRGQDMLSRANKINLYRSRVGMVFQSFNLFSNMTVMDNCLTGQIRVLKRCREEARKRALHFLDKVGMAPYINARPRQLSGGQQQRVAIARALAMDPDLLLFDEPTSALDPEMVGEVLEVMRDLSREKITLLVVTHEMAFARDVSSEVFFMHDGKIHERGRPEALLVQPQTVEAREFLSRFMQ